MVNLYAYGQQKGTIFKMGKVTIRKAYQQAAVTLMTAARVAEERGSGEELANIALTWMELATRMESSESEDNNKDKKHKMGFHHE